MSNYTEARIEAGLKPRTSDILADLRLGHMDCLYFATESQVDMLITRGQISEDMYSEHQARQEEMRCMLAE